MDKHNLAARCGVYCGACRTYLLEKKDLFEEKGYKMGCKGCKEQDKNCSFVKKGCNKLKNKEIKYCYECENMPCEDLARISTGYKKRYGVDIVLNAKKMKEIGVDNWLEEQKDLYTCPDCGGEICVHDAECFDCGRKGNPNKVARDTDIAGSCGLYCGACKYYLANKKGISEQKGFKRVCMGCQARKNKCAIIQKTCVDLRKDHIEHCFECKGEIPCDRLERLQKSYMKNYNINLIKNLERMNEVGVENWLQEQVKLYKCPECGGEICLHDRECYDCGLEHDPNKK